LKLSAVERLATGLRWAEGPVWVGDGRYLLCSDIPNQRILKWEEETGAVSVYRKPSNFANGNTRDRQGRLGNYEGYKAEPEIEPNVYRIDGATGKATLAAEGVLGPNGLCFSPDEKILYVVESRGVPNRKILAYDVSADGTKLSNKRVHIDAGPGTPDGMRCDIDGNLWCGWGMGDPNLDGVMV